MRGCFVCQKNGRLPYVFREDRMERLRNELEMPDEIITEENLERHKEFLRRCEVIFCTWGMLELDERQIEDYFPSLKVIFYAAASVRYFAEPFLKRGVRIITCHRIMAVPVAQFTVASIVFANKGALMAMREYRKLNFAANRLPQNEYPGTYGTKVGILGAGSIGSLVIRMLRSYPVSVMVYDPFVTDERREELGIDRLYSLDEIFGSCQTVSCHIANNERTVGMLDYRLFSKMPPTGAFINTGRGAQVVEADLIRALKEEPLRTAILDVTYPEPPSRDSELFSLDNVFLFPHIAGSSRDEVLSFADFVTAQFFRYRAGQPFEDCEVTLEMLEIMA